MSTPCGPVSGPYPELWPGLLQRLRGGVQRAPLVGELGPPALPALQEQRGPHHVKEGEHHAADVPARLMHPSGGRAAGTKITAGHQTKIQMNGFINQNPHVTRY